MNFSHILLRASFVSCLQWVETQRYEYTKLKRAAVDLVDETLASTKPDMETPVTPATTDVAASNTRNTMAQLPTGAPNLNANRPANPRLTPERLNRLESIGFEWKVKNKMKRYYDKQWDVMFQTLLNFKKKYGHCNVPKRFQENARLGTWVHTQ